MKRYLVAFTALMFSLTVEAVEFPGPNPGKAASQLDREAKEYSLSNAVIEVSWREINGQLVLSSINNKLTKESYPQSSLPFVLYMAGSDNGISDWEIINTPSFIKLEKDSTPGCGRNLEGIALAVDLQSTSTGIKVRWTAEMRDQAGYIRTTIKLSCADTTKTIGRIELIHDLKLDASTSEVGTYKQGSPVQSKQMFVGMEVPFFTNSIKGNRVSSGFKCKLKLGEGVSYSFSSVIGVYPEDQFRRSFLHYIERERARSYKPFLHYNCWFDLERGVSETGMLDRINFIHRELGEKRGVQVISYVVDDGYDDYNKGFWAFDEKKFPNGFSPLAKRLNEIGSNLGIWLSPDAGYRGNGQRKARAREIGIDSMNLSNSNYYEWFLARHTRFIKEDRSNYFKWDKLGGGVSGHFMALMDIAHKLRALNPDLFINTTVGTWQSPFWLNHVDSTWRGGSDMGFQGKGCNREQWLTYRDGISYNVIKESGFIYPLNALMNHGIVYSDGHGFAKKALQGSKDIRNEVRSYFGGGYALQELYINPHILEKEHWDAIAEAAAWAKEQASVLVDSHFIGGDPNKLEVYGFAAWRNNKGTITLRNPNDIIQIYNLDISSAFELPKNTCQNYLLKSPYPDQRIAKLDVTAKKPVAIELKPFEVLVFDAYPKKIEQENTPDKK